MDEEEVLILYTHIKDWTYTEKYRTYLNQLPDFIQQQIDEYFCRKDKIRGILGKMLLLKGVKQLGNANKHSLNDLKYTEHNRPFLSSSNLDFNISHSNSLVVCALSKQVRLGIDVEFQNQANILNFKNLFSLTQWEALETTANPHQLFYQYWAQKEAISKADGSGLSSPFNQIEIHYNSASYNNKYWLLQSIDIDDQYSAWLATEREVNLLLYEVFF